VTTVGDEHSRTHCARRLRARQSSDGDRRFSCPGSRGSLVSTPNPTCGPSWPGVSVRLWIPSRPGAHMSSCICAGCRKSPSALKAPPGTRPQGVAEPVATASSAALVQSVASEGQSQREEPGVAADESAGSERGAGQAIWPARREGGAAWWRLRLAPCPTSTGVRAAEPPSADAESGPAGLSASGP
jgi:hypothetical protein